MTKVGDIATVRTGLVVSRKKAQLDSVYKIEYEQISLRYFGDGVKLNKFEEDKFVSVAKIDSKYFTQEGVVVVRLRSSSSAVYIGTLTRLKMSLSTVSD